MEEQKKEPGFELPVLKCLHCGHEWHPRTPEWPKVCPICKRTNWDRPKESSAAD